MTEYQQPPMRPPLRRSSTDRVFAGVCGGLARTLGVDATIIRVLTAVLILAGGAGLLGYLLAWLVIPDDYGTTIVGGPRDGRSRGGKFVVAVLIALLIMSLVSIVTPFDNNGTGFLIGLLALVVVWQAFGHDLVDRTHVTHSATPTGMSVTGDDGQTVTVTSPLGETVIRQDPPSPLGRITWNLLLIVAGVAIALQWAGIIEVSAPYVIATMLVIVGASLIISAFAGRARGLIAAGVILCVFALPTSWAPSADVGQREWTLPAVSTEASTFTLGVGDATLDLTNFATAEDRTTTAKISVGTLTVQVPKDSTLRYVINAHVGLGDLVLLGTKHSGSDVSECLIVGSSDAAAKVVTVNADVALGKVEVRNA